MIGVQTLVPIPISQCQGGVGTGRGYKKEGEKKDEGKKDEKKDKKDEKKK